MVFLVSFVVTLAVVTVVTVRWIRQPLRESKSKLEDVESFLDRRRDQRRRGSRNGGR